MKYQIPGQDRRRGATRALGHAPIEIATHVNGVELVPSREVSIEGCIPSFVGWYGGSMARRPLTLYSYAGHLRSFTAWARERHVLLPKDVTYRMLEDYFGYLLNVRRLKPVTAFAHMAALKAFWKYLTREGVVPQDISQLVMLPKYPPHRQLPRIIPPDGPAGQDALLRALAENHSLRGQRDHALIAVELLAGLRVSEVCRLAVEDVDFDAELIYVNDSKGGKSRQVYLAPRLAQILRHYLDVVRPALMSRPMGWLARASNGSPYWQARWFTGDGKRVRRSTRSTDRREAERLLHEWVPARPPSRWLFVHAHPSNSYSLSHGDRPLDPRSVLLALKQRVVPIIGRNAWNHLMRHSYASRLRARGADLMVMADQMGHANLDTLRIYAALLPDDTKKLMAGYLAESDPPPPPLAPSTASTAARPPASVGRGDQVASKRPLCDVKESAGFTLEQRRLFRERRGRAPHVREGDE